MTAWPASWSTTSWRGSPERRELHDKIEFEVAATCRHFAFADDRARIGAGAMTDGEGDAFEGALGAVTARAPGPTG